MARTRRALGAATFLISLGLAVACGSGGSAKPGGSGGTSSGSGGTTGAGGKVGNGGSTTGGTRNPVCKAGTSSGPVQKPVFWKNLPGETSWFSSPVVQDLGHDGKNELIIGEYSLFVYDSNGNLLDKVSPGSGRIYAPVVVGDLDGNGTTDIVFGNGGKVYAYEWVNNKLVQKPGWPVDTTTAGQTPEVRGLAAGDLDGSGKLEVVATTTQTQPTSKGGAQVFVWGPDGKLYQPPGISWQAWPRYNDKTGTGNDADTNGQGESGYGCYGLNVGIGNIDDDPDLEIIVTYDNHSIQAFKKDGTSIDASPWFTNPDSKYLGQRMTWGQFIRWADPAVEKAHYHDHTGAWPSVTQTEWLQWTASPPNIVDLNGDGKNEVVGVPNEELHDPYVTQSYAIMALQGAYNNGANSAMRQPGWETLPHGGSVMQVSGYYPPTGIPAAATVNIQGDSHPEIIVSLNDGFMYAFDYTGKELWRFNYTFGHSIMYASEPIVADLNQDGSPEVLFTTYGDPNTTDSGHLVILGADGKLLWDTKLPNPGHNGNGNGAPAAPAVGDLTGDGELEVFVQTFDHGTDIFKIPGSGTNCLLWPTARGGPLRMGQPNGN